MRKSGQQLLKLVGHEGTIGRSEGTAAFSPDGRYVVTTCTDQTTMIWNANTGELVGKLERQGSGFTGANFSPNGRRIVTSSFDKVVQIWDVQSQQAVDEFVFNHPIYSASYSPDGLHVVVTSTSRWRLSST